MGGGAYAPHHPARSLARSPSLVAGSPCRLLVKPSCEAPPPYPLHMPHESVACGILWSMCLAVIVLEHLKSAVQRTRGGCSDFTRGLADLSSETKFSSAMCLSFWSECWECVHRPTAIGACVRVRMTRSMRRVCVDVHCAVWAPSSVVLSRRARTSPSCQAVRSW